MRNDVTCMYSPSPWFGYFPCLPLFAGTFMSSSIRSVLRRHQWVILIYVCDRAYAA